MAFISRGLQSLSTFRLHRDKYMKLNDGIKLVSPILGEFTTAFYGYCHLRKKDADGWERKYKVASTFVARCGQTGMW